MVVVVGGGGSVRCWCSAVGWCWGAGGGGGKIPERRPVRISTHYGVNGAAVVCVFLCFQMQYDLCRTVMFSCLDSIFDGRQT